MLNDETSQHISLIGVLADNGGLSSDQFGLIVHQLTRLKCSATLARKMIHLLVPSDRIPASHLVDLTLWGLCHASVDCVIIPVIKVNTLCLQYECVQDKQELAGLYELFLSQLGKDKRTGPIAELLQLLTTRAEVTEWRVKAVLRCQASQGSSHQLDTLLWKYRQWRPDLIPSCKAPTSKQAHGKDVLSQRYLKQWEMSMDNSLRNADSQCLWNGGLQRGNVYKKSQRTYLLPDKDVLSVAKVKNGKISEVKAISDLNSLNELIDNIHQIQLPANVLSILGNTACIHILSMDETLMERFSINIYHLLRNEFILTDSRKISITEKKRKFKRGRDILELLIKLQENVMQGLPVIGRFLTEYMELWNGKDHFSQVTMLVSQLQISDYKEVFDCIISPLLSNHFQSYSQLKQIIVLNHLHRLLRLWSVVEMDRFTNHRRTVFPTNTINCTNALEAIHQLSVTIGEWSTLCLALSRQNVQSTHMLTTQILTEYKLSQAVMMKHNIPMRLEVPTPYLYDSLFSHSGALMAMACQYIFEAKKRVLPMINNAFRDSELEHGAEHPNTLTIEKMSSDESKEDLLTATRDFLVFLSPCMVNLTPKSILRQGWDLPEEEESLRETLFISCHPAMLPFVLTYIDGLNLDEESKRKAWYELSQEQEDHSEVWAANISISEGRPKFVSRNFYSSSKSSKNPRLDSVPENNTGVLGNISDFLKLLAKYLPPINDLVMEFKQTTSGSNLLPPGATASTSKDTDLRSIISQQTVDSGVESLHPAKKRRTVDEDEETENVEERITRSTRRQSGTPLGARKKKPGRSRSGALADVSNSRV